MTKLEKLLIMKDYFPDAKAELNYNTPFQLLIAVTLSAQTTDKAVNKVTNILFINYDNAYKLKNATYEDIYNIIKTIGLSKTKTKNIIALSKIYDEDFNNIMPNSVEELIVLPGVGKKTAKVCLSQIYGSNYMAVDTHIERICKRCAIVPENYNVDKISISLERLLKNQEFGQFHNSLIYFGRYHCKAQNPKCTSSDCKLKTVCRYYKKNIKK